MTAATIDPLFLELQGILAGRYSLERELGRGGMGIVYLARDVGLDRPVAIKLLPPGLAADAALRERFLREARTAARLSHPNIVPIHAVEESGRLVWFVMAYVPGESLGQRLRLRGALTPADASRILRDIAWALGHAHAQRVVHRDVKPDNILLEAGGRRALIADFGIAAPARSDLGPEGGVVGTVAYLSPEQARGDPVDGRSDLYALGVVGYCALSGRLPYPATTLAELVERQIAGTPPPLAAAAPHVPRALCRVIDRCLAGYPSARFPTGEELAEALEHLGAATTDLPAPFRVWITRAERPRSAIALISVLWGLPLALGALVALFAGGSHSWYGALAALSFAGLPWLLYGGARLMQTRRLLRAGYGHSDIVLALETHALRRREELAFEFAGGSGRVGRVLRIVTLAGVAFALGAVGVVVLAPFNGRVGLLGFAGLSAFVAFLAQAIGRRFPSDPAGLKDRWAEFAVKFWKSRIGRGMTRFAGWGLGHNATPEHLLHRPTEVALGEAAEALFKALPSVQQRDLKRLPEQIRYLSTQAQEVRRKVEELDDLIAQAAPDTLFGQLSTAGGDGGAAELTEARNLWAGRLRETVTLLESLRVGLLKLHAGSAVPETLTADLDAARELRERLSLLGDALVEAESTVLPPPDQGG
jgi:eukaryotic-like serine/threonine-protein kinase